MALTDEDKVWISTTMAELLRPTNSRLDGIDTRLDAVDARFDRLDDYILQFRNEVAHRFNALDLRMEFLVNSVPNAQPLTKAMLDLGSLMGQLTRSQQHSTDRHFDLETRVLKIEETLSKLVNRAA
jgi:hypothetical protein